MKFPDDDIYIYICFNILCVWLYAKKILKHHFYSTSFSTIIFVKSLFFSLLTTILF
ncbi:hypothetical protein BDC45DRAFT_498224 [Circinella umbellata]|nr:hypothetical protein BDC45DRAFT_498224 [Circinella umbellata]